MKKMGYLGHQTIQHMIHLRKRYLLYVVSFYIGLLLPVLCVANYRFIDTFLEVYLFEGMENTVQIDWLSSSFETTGFDVPGVYSVKGMYQEVVLDWDSLPLTIVGRDENHFEDMPHVRGRVITHKELKRGDAVCLLDMESSKKYHCGVGDVVRINNHELRVVGVIADTVVRSHIIIPLTMMEKIYGQSGMEMQYSGTFMLKENQDKDQFISDVSAMIQAKDEQAKILFTTTGEELYQQAIHSVARWKTLRAIIALGAVLFFLINETIIIIGKMQRERKVIGIKMALGISAREVGICYLIETMCITLAADLLVFLTISPLAKMFFLDKIILFDHFVVIVTLIGSFGTSTMIAFAVIHNLKRHQISGMFTLEEV
ncbi:ABC transporter permease [Faecalicatena contorta]|uniref:MacB-like core domain-containing protein n=1 Tax=Faecalicatena contorta TaxID=39482 RepID=A0A315ZX11_9FIRM|nr:ABC transporter permease [Faecalicatena contorta]PWJ49772.1 MacB-like protein [Faecalicatena contorta]SUQ14490.1 MacB-like core domain-containing protein [Faecalicatena contorta]